MSKLVSRIEKISRGSPAPIGFGASGRTSRTPAMALIGVLSGNSTENAKCLADLDADGAIISATNSTEDFTSLAEALGSTPWGIMVDHLDGKTADGLIQQGCDFFLADAGGISVEAAKDERAAFVLSLPKEASDGFLRAIEDLPITAAFTSLAADGPMTLKDLVDVGSLRTMFDKYLLVKVNPDLSSKELEGLRDMGVDAVVVDLAGASQDSLKSLKQRLIKLPRQRKARSEKSNAVLPSGLSGGNAHTDHDEE